MPADYRLGRLKGDYVVTWWEGESVIAIACLREMKRQR